MSKWANPPLGDLSRSLLFREPSTLEYLVGSAEFFTAVHGLLTRDISIIGYTDSFRIKTPEALIANEEKLSNGFTSPEILYGFKCKLPSNLWALGWIVYQIRAGQLLFPCSVEVSPAEAIRKIVDMIGNLPTIFAGIKFDEDGFPNKRGNKIKMDHSSQCLLGGRVANIEAEYRVEDAISYDGADTGLYGPKEAQRNQLVLTLNDTQYRAHVKSDPTLFWKPSPRIRLTYIDRLHQNPEEPDNEELIVEMARHLAKIRPKETGNLLDLLITILQYISKTHQPTTKLVKHP